MPKQATKVRYFSVTITPKDGTHIAWKQVKGWMVENTTRWSFQLEKGKEAGKLHYQCHLYVEKQTRDTRIAKSILESFEANVHCRPCASITGSEFYSMKEDTRVDGPWADKKVYLGQDVNAVKNDPFPWQKSIIDEIESDPDDRTIHWIMNTKGNVGKSKLSKYLGYTKKATRVPLGTATQIKTYVIASGPARAYLVDLPRVCGTSESQRDLFSALEEIKNGDIISAMYGKVQTMFMACPHLFIFSNEKPNYAYASADRWKVWHVDESRTLQKGPDPSPI